MIILWQHYKHSNQTDNSVSISNSVPLESPTHEHSISGTVSEKKVKPPAIPPKTYREPKVELNITLCSSDDDASAQSINDDVYSVGSDSLYDMKLEAASEVMKLPKRSTDKESAQSCVTVIKSTFQKSDDTEVKSIKSKEKVTDEISGTQDGDDANYQKLDIKTISPPSHYENLHSLRIKERVINMAGISQSLIPDKCNQRPSIQATMTHYS